MAERIAHICSSLDALMREFDIVTHNLANVSTVGYKRRCSSFSKSLEAQQGAQGETDCCVTSNAQFDFSQGNVVETGRPLDVALYGKGFLVVETPEGPLYTRNGIFHLNQNRQIVNSDGRILAGQLGPITIPSNIGLSQLHIASDGTINAGQTTIDSLKLVDFTDKEGRLVPAGANCFRKPEEVEPAAAEQVIVKQGYQEASNVRMVDELVSMITVSRLYEANMRFVSATKDASGSLIEVASA
jgi:flagellar basal body rod protein FlgG